MHLGPFGCLTKLSAKRAEVVQKFVPRSRVLIFRNKHTRFDPLGPKLMFWYFHTIWIHLVPFGCLIKLGAKRAEVVQKFVPWCSVGIFYNKIFDPPHWILTSCFFAFRTIWVHLGQFVALQQSVQNRPNWCKSSCHDVASEFLTTNASDPPDGTRNTCLGVFCTIWLHLGPFGCLTKLSAKRAEVVQKFVPWSRVRIFRNERARSTLLDPYLMFWCVSYYLGAFGIVCCITTLSSKRAKLVQKFVPRSRVRIFRNERTRSTPLDSKLMFLCVSHSLDVFGTVWLPTKLGAKLAEVVQKFVPWSRFGIFCNECTRSTLSALTSCFSVFRTIWVHLG